MKTTRNLVHSSVGIIVSGLLAAAAFAGPPAATKPAPKLEGSPTVKCDGCKTTPISVVSDRGPAGKGVPGTRVVGSQHSCARCAGTNTVEHGKVKNAMIPNAVCGPLLCCK